MASGEKRKHTTKDLDLCKWECAGYIYIQRCRIYRKEYQWFYSTVLRKLYDPHHNSSGTYSVLSFFWLFFVQKFLTPRASLFTITYKKTSFIIDEYGPGCSAWIQTHNTLVDMFFQYRPRRPRNQPVVDVFNFFFFWWKSNDWATSKEEEEKKSDMDQAKRLCHQGRRPR